MKDVRKRALRLLRKLNARAQQIEKPTSLKRRMRLIRSFDRMSLRLEELKSEVGKDGRENKGI